ncbi:MULTISPECIES: sugar kinase [unclassified Streptomyces]|uniref:sugar kinase n=1 Tax=unclassified Streptomyces TaxID=2593676 RepID=UPI0023671791|nr:MULTISPECIES: sugar kinase [unclassified Streptomyces]MDF3149994.1 sugar kinase [Streptomyces sp. T21Q-yed]WDF42436.1 sugar kinase [Streptomyces sp. T12]
MTVTVPRQADSPDEPQPPAEDRRHMIRRRAITLLIIGLLIGVPAGYLVISANQSRDSGKDKEEKYSATGLTPHWPSRVQRRLYQIPVPDWSYNVAYYETNNWKTSRLYVQFQTADANLDWFFKTMGVSRDDLKRDAVTISARDQKVTGWDFTGPGPWYGFTHKQKNPAPTQDVVINMSDPANPFVYVVSRTVP